MRAALRDMKGLTKMHKILISAMATATLLGGVPAAQASEIAKKQPAPTFTTTTKEGRKAVRAALKQTKSTSASVALVSNGKVVWSQTFGRVNTAGKKPSPTTMYGVGSVSKTVTAMAVMQLVDAGKVSLDAPVVRYIPDFSMKSPQYRQITVRMLLNHSAGLPGTDYANGISYRPISSYVDGVLSGLRTSRLKTTPGAMNVYCNDCFTLAGVVVERVSGMPLPDYVAKNIFKPLGMKHSVYPTSLPLSGTAAPVIEGGKKQPFQVTNILASGGLLSTPNDMARLAMVFTGQGVVGGKRILSSAAVEQMAVDQTTTTLEAAPPSAFRYGLGWDTVQDPALKSAGVRGWTKGGDLVDYHAGFVIAPDQGLAAIVGGAGTTFSSSSAEAIAQTVLLNALVETGAIKKMPKQLGGEPAKDKPTPKQVKRMTAVYLAQGASLKVTEGKNRSLRLSLLADGEWVRQPGRLVRRADGAFWSTEVPGRSIRSVRAWDRTYLVMRSIGGTGTFRTDHTLGQRTRSAGSLPAAWSQRVGQRWLLSNEDPSSVNWTLSEPGVKITAVPGLSGYLVAEGALIASVPFAATASDSLGSMFLEIPLLSGRDLYDFDFSKRDGEEYLTFSSSVLRPAATVPSLAAGSNAIAIGSQGYVEWYKVPNASNVTVSGQSNWKLFDDKLSLLDSGGAETATKQAPAGAYIAVFGPAGSTATVVVGS